MPALKENAAGGKPQTVRERLEDHRKNVVCSTCHASMDPLGFALENFDAVGSYRTTDADAPIDANGTLPGDVKFQGAEGLRQVLTTTYGDQFVRTAIEKLLTYAIGRGLEPADMPAVRAIAREAAPDGHRWSSVIASIVRSMPFQMRRAQS